MEIKRRAGIDAVEQLSRYLELLNRDPLLRPVSGVLVVYGDPRGAADPGMRLFSSMP